MASIDAYGGCDTWRFDKTGYFRLERTPDRWWLVDPDGNGFITIGLNHADETNLKYPHNREIWKRKYGSRTNWIKNGVVADLNDWGFNTIGWTAEYISGDWGVALDWFGDPIDLGHSTGWCAQDYPVADMPYCLVVRVAEIEDWKGDPAYPDVFTRDFDVYCEYLARSICLEHAESKNLIGYFLVDIPGWLRHASGDDFPSLTGLDEASRETKLYDVASKYYETITRHIRSHDPNHLILGDRYNGNKGIPGPVLEAMKPYVDVLSVQYFPGPSPEDHEQMRVDLGRWHEQSGKPVLIADIGNWSPTKLNPNRVSGIEDQAGRARDYKDAIGAVLNEPWFLGWHWCAYVENTARGWGAKDPWDEPYEDFVDPVRKFNRGVYEAISSARTSTASTTT